MTDIEWTGGDLPTFVTHLECGLTGDRYEADRLHGLSKAGRPLLVRYDLDGVGRALTKDMLAARPQTLWRYREMLPVRRPENVVSLGEVVTPLVSLPRIAGDIAKGGEIIVKDEGRLPTGSFKARGLVMAVSMAKELGITTMAMPTNGNAGAAMAAYCARAGMKAYVFCPDDTPDVNVREIAMQGAEVFLVDGLIDDCGRLVAEGEKAVGWFNCSTLREPYRIEGKKTMGIELAEQLGWEMPDVIFYPDRRRHRDYRHVEGVRRARSHGLDRQEAAAHGSGAGDGLRADGQGLGRGRRARAALAGRAHFRRRHSGAAWRSAIS